MNTSATAEKITRIARDAAARNGFEFIHADVTGTKRNPVLRIFVDKDGGITVDDCGKLSREVEAVLDADDLIPSAYVLEVSSPGLERELYSLNDFRKFTGRKARLKTNVEINGKKAFKGTIEAIDNEDVIFNDRGIVEVRIPYSSVSKANLIYDMADDLKHK